MKKTSVSIGVLGALLMASALSLTAQGRSVTSTRESAVAVAGHGAMLMDGSGTPYHPFEVKAFCGEESVKQGKCAKVGDEFYSYQGHNLRTAAGTTWQFAQMAGTPVAAGTFLGLSADSTAVAEADTSIATELNANGITRSSATVVNSSGNLGSPGTPSGLATVGTAGSTTYWYAVAACNQGICGTPSSGASIATGNATLSTANYLTGAFVGVAGASSYQVLRNTSNSFTGTASLLTSAEVWCSTAGSVVTCNFNDVSSTLTSITVGANTNTNFGVYTLVHLWTAATSSTPNIQKYGVFNASSGPTLIFAGLFTPVTLQIGDTLQLTETVYY